ncbi:DUF4349 domain-containing protein [Ferruginibacter sp.]|uniref:DUF4349 domain-containing protein n=1 Tax=Ferruginibacter sp. TaxID=1940288 RepID=UPI0034652B14
MPELKKAAPSQHSDNQTSAKEKIPVGTLQVGNADTASVPLQVKTVSNPDWNKKIIRTAHVKIEVSNFQQYNDNIHTIVKHFGGYVAQEEQHTTDEKRKPRLLSKCLWTSLTIL